MKEAFKRLNQKFRDVEVSQLLKTVLNLTFERKMLGMLRRMHLFQNYFGKNMKS